MDIYPRIVGLVAARLLINAHLMAVAFPDCFSGIDNFHFTIKKFVLKTLVSFFIL